MRVKIAILLLFAWAGLPAQDFTYPVTLVNVSFEGGLSYPPEWRRVPVRNDITEEFYEEPHFITASHVSEPVAYVSGARPWVSALFQIDESCSPNPPTNLYIRGEGRDAAVDHIFPVRYANRTSGGHFFYGYGPSSATFQTGLIDYYDPFIIDWFISIDGIKWVPAGSSFNTMYVLMSPNPVPENNAKGYLYLESLFDISCRAAKDVSSGSDLYNQLKQKFSTLDVKRRDGEPLYYYNSYNNGHTFSKELIKYKDGECGSWAKLFIDLHSLHGIRPDPDNPNNYVTVRNINIGHGLYVGPHWDFIGSGSYPGDPGIPPEFTYMNVFNPTSYTIVMTPTGPSVQPFYYNSVLGRWEYSWYFADVPYKDASIEVSQWKNKRPAARFGNHQFVKMFGEYFDPSYGQTYTNEANFQSKVNGFFIPKYIADSPTTGIYLDVIKKNTPTSPVEIFFTLSSHQ